MSNQIVINGVTISWEGDTLQDKLNAMDVLGIPYIPTSQELSDASDFDTIKFQIRTEYLNMITRLEQIQNAGAIPFTQTGFNQVVQAIKDEALYIERIMKAIKFFVK